MRSHDYLGLSGKKKTSDDGLFTLETVACLGACGLAPVMTIDGEVHAKMTPEAALAHAGGAPQKGGGNGMTQAKMTRDSFHVFQANAKNALKQSEQVPSVLICAGTGCIAGGAMKIYENFKSGMSKAAACRSMWASSTTAMRNRACT